jgi:hypothetical protein
MPKVSLENDGHVKQICVFCCHPDEPVSTKIVLYQKNPSKEENPYNCSVSQKEMKNNNKNT